MEVAVFNHLSVAWFNRFVGLHTCFYGLDNLANVYRGCDTLKEKEVKCVKCGKKINTTDEGVVCFKIRKKEETWFCKACGDGWIKFLREFDLI